MSTVKSALDHKSGALVHVNSSFRAVYGYDQRIEAFGEKGMLISRNQQPTRNGVFFLLSAVGPAINVAPAAASQDLVA